LAIEARGQSARKLIVPRFHAHQFQTHTNHPQVNRINQNTRNDANAHICTHSCLAAAVAGSAILNSLSTSLQNDKSCSPQSPDICSPRRNVASLTLVVHPPPQDPTQLGRDPGRTGHIVSAILFAPPFSTPNPGIYRVGGTEEWAEPPSLYPS